MNLFELKAQREHALNKADALVNTAAAAKRELTSSESLEVDTCMLAVNSLNPRIKEIESKNTITKMFPKGVVLIDGGRKYTQQKQVTLSADYPDAFYSYVASAGRKLSAALYEGSEAAGGYAVPVIVDDQIVPLAPQEMAVRRLAQVIPTAMDIKVPQKESFGTATAKAENSAFAEIDPTLGRLRCPRSWPVSRKQSLGNLHRTCQLSRRSLWMT